MRKLILLLLAVCILHFSVLPSYGLEKNRKEENIVLTPADQLILDRIGDMSREVNVRFEKMAREMKDRFENLWITMLGGFIGVMAFIGGLVFWDRKTLVKHAKAEFHDEIGGDRQKIEALLLAMRKLSPRFPEVKEALKSFGLL